MNKGTLTLLDGNRTVIGFPTDNGRYSDSEMQRISLAVEDWLDNGGTLRIPFPVEVIDLRSPRVKAPNAVNHLDSLSVTQVRDLVGVAMASSATKKE